MMYEHGVKIRRGEESVFYTKSLPFAVKRRIVGRLVSGLPAVEEYLRHIPSELYGPSPELSTRFVQRTVRPSSVDNQIVVQR